MYCCNCKLRTSRSASQDGKCSLKSWVFKRVGKKSLESAILDEFTYLANDIEALNGKNEYIGYSIFAIKGQLNEANHIIL